MWMGIHKPIPERPSEGVCKRFPPGFGMFGYLKICFPFPVASCYPAMGKQIFQEMSRWLNCANRMYVHPNTTKPVPEGRNAPSPQIRFVGMERPPHINSSRRDRMKFNATII